jgi:hypothetical protein
MKKVCSMTSHLTTLGSTHDTYEATFDQALQKSRPERLGPEEPMPSPTISRRPSVVTTTAIIAVTETVRPL